ESKQPARLEAPGGGGEKSGNDRPGYPTLARSESPASARSAEPSSSAPEKAAPEPRHPEPKQPPAESKPPAEKPPEPSDAYIPRPRPAAPTEAPRTGDGNVGY